jgi:copper chaperone CopZ
MGLGQSKGFRLVGKLHTLLATVRGVREGVSVPSYSFQVLGMTCDHCVTAVTAALSVLHPVTAVSVQLVPTGESTVTVIASSELGDDGFRAAVSEAGYELVGKPESS